MPKALKTQPTREQTSPWWLNGAFVILTHVIALVTIIYYPLKFNTAFLTYLQWQLATLGITMGYHRLWSHRSFEAALPLRIALAFMGTLGFQGSIKWWVLRHRLHHRFTDTDHDPYNATKGFYHSHIGWIFKKPYYPRLKLIDATDLKSDPVVVFQHSYYVPLAFFSGFVLPSLIGLFWGDAMGCYLYGGFVSRILIWHATFLINSFAHTFGDQPFTDEVTAKGNLLLALLTNGEGYHNFHHEFPKDYRNGIDLWDWDPTKWLIYAFHSLTNQIPLLHVTPDNEIIKARSLTFNSKANALSSQCEWGPTDDSLPCYSYSQFQDLSQRKKWLIIDNYVIDFESFQASHPGGYRILEIYRGKDATKAFYGGLNNHTQAARTMLRMLKVGKIV